MSRGMFKFVLDTQSNLYLGYSGSYHMNICGRLPAEKVQAAGYLDYAAKDGWIVNGSSLGYCISYSRDDRDVIEEMLKDYDSEKLFTEIKTSYGRVVLKKQ